jgi:signal transduction histidine kinase
MSLSARLPDWRRGIAALIVAAGLLPPAPAAAQVDSDDTSDQKRVLVIHSTRRDSLIAEAAERVLAQEFDTAFGVRVDYYSEFIDPARFPDTSYASFNEVVRRRYSDLNPHVVIAIEEAAIGFITKFRYELFADAPVVFFARDAAATRPPNSTGVIEPIDFARTVELIAALQPEVTEVIVLSGSSARDEAYEQAARRQFERFAPRLTFTYVSGAPLRELEYRLGALPPNAVVYPLLMSRSREGNFRPREINTRVAQLANRPTYGWHERHHGDGYVGGGMLQLAPALSLLAQRAVRVLNGERPDSIEVARPPQQVNRVDARQLRRWGISATRVPAGFAIEFEEATMWQRYRSYAISAGVILMVQSALIAGLLVQAQRRFRAERELRRSQQELTQSYERVRDIGGRLLTAQETERARIARELHDDIGQQMAVLGVELRDEGHRDKALERLSQIARSVHDLSHRLHPASLKFMGLVGAIRALQGEYLQSQMQVRFVHSNVPSTVPPELSLALFRVAQETLHNAAKYSQATEVVVDLTCRDGRLLLDVTDNGVGFNVKKEWGKGLGLISIRERIEAVGGTVAVESQPGHGTRFAIDVPL